MDIATVGVGVLAVFAPGPSPGETGRSPVQEVRLVLGAVAPTPIRARAAEQVLTGRTLDEDADRAGEPAKRPKKPGRSTDVRASAEYRTTLVEVLSRRALRAARSWAEKGGRE